MKDEIKEILDNLKNGFCSALTYEKLLDYITNLQEENKRLKENAIHNDKVVDKAKWNEMLYKSRNEKANSLLDEMLERAYIDGEYIMYDYSTSELLEIKQALQGEDKE